MKWVHFRVKTWFFARHFVIVPCVFMHIAGSIFIFNISKRQLPASDPEKHIGEQPKWGIPQIDNQQSRIDNQPQAGILHPLHEPRIFVPRVLTPEI